MTQGLHQTDYGYCNKVKTPFIKPPFKEITAVTIFSKNLVGHHVKLVERLVL